MARQVARKHKQQLQSNAINRQTDRRESTTATTSECPKFERHKKSKLVTDTRAAAYARKLHCYCAYTYICTTHTHTRIHKIHTHLIALCATAAVATTAVVTLGDGVWWQHEPLAPDS